MAEAEWLFTEEMESDEMEAQQMEASHHDNIDAHVVNLGEGADDMDVLDQHVHDEQIKEEYYAAG